MPLDMNPEIRAAWCAALRSGDYTQITGALRRLPEELTGDTGDTAGYCCLGVLTDLWLKAGNGEMIPDDLGEHPGEDVISVWADPQGILSPPVAEWAGLDSADPLLGPDGASDNRAAVLNDGGVPFAWLADLIDGGVSQP